MWRAHNGNIIRDGWRYVNMDSNTVIAVATVVLAIITAVYAQNARKIKAIEKKLDEFYYPLKHEIFKCKSEKYGNDTKYLVSNASFIERLYLCQNDHIRFVLKKFLDPQSNINEKDFIDLQEFIEKDIEDLVKELDTLQSIKNNLIQKIRKKLPDGKKEWKV